VRRRLTLQTGQCLDASVLPDSPPLAVVRPPARRGFTWRRRGGLCGGTGVDRIHPRGSGSGVAGESLTGPSCWDMFCHLRRVTLHRGPRDVNRVQKRCDRLAQRWTDCSPFGSLVWPRPGDAGDSTTMGGVIATKCVGESLFAAAVPARDHSNSGWRGGQHGLVSW